jgi:hypothetical protein
MADVAACTASQFHIFHQYLHMFHSVSLQEHFKTPTIFWEIFFSALLPLLGTVTELPAEGEVLPCLWCFRPSSRLYLHLLLMILFRTLLLS